jgi:hypothetical protein
MRALLASLTSDGGLTTPLAGLAAAVLGVSGISASIITGKGDPETAWSADAISIALQDLQFTLGEGPSIDAAVQAALMMTPDLEAVPALRWPVFAAAAAEIGVRALFVFPLRIGAIGLGTMEVYRAEPGPLSVGEFRDALVLADAVTTLLLQLPSVTEPFVMRTEVHQATGMVAVQLGAGLSEALARLRAYSFASNRSINHVAADVVACRLDFTEEE